jgi:ferredoxin
MFGLKYIAGVTTLKLDDDLCIGCGVCLTVCPHAVLRSEAKKVAINHPDACMECGACAMNCPTDAIQVASGVGCAAAVINGALRGTEPSCDCGGSDGGSCC